MVGISRYVRPLLLVLALTCVASPARGQIGRWTYPSVEFVVSQAKTVVRGKVLSMSERRGAPNQFELVIAAVEYLKGSGPIQIVLPVPQWQYWQAIARRKAEVVVCTEMGAANFASLTMAATSAGFAATPGHEIVYDLSSQHPYTYSMDLRLIREPADVLAAIRAAAVFKGERWFARKSLENHITLPLLATRGPAADIVVPLDSRLELVAKRWMSAPEIALRYRAVAALDPLPTESSTALLRELLNDPMYDFEPMRRWENRIPLRAVRIYPIRGSAAQALEHRGVFAIPELVGPDMIYFPPQWRYPVIAAVVLIGAAGFIGRWQLGRSFAALLALLAIGVCVLWWRSGRVIDSASLATATTEHEITSAGGKVSWLRVVDDPKPREWLFRYAAMDLRYPLWFERYLSTTTQAGRAGFAAWQGVVAGEKTAYRFQLTRIPYWAIAMMLGVWPLASVFAAMHYRLRQRRWRKSNRCGRCGYDLRGLAGRCPECGAMPG